MDRSISSGTTSSFCPSFVEKLDISALGSLASTARRECSNINVNVTCSVMTPPEIGAYNVVFILEFSDGIKWIARISIMEWTPTLQDRLRRDIISMQFVQSKTSLPIPEVHAFSCDCDNLLGRPYVLLSHVEGKQLSELWFDPEWFTESHRHTVFRSLAQIMSTLATLEFPQIGQLDRDPNTQDFFVGPIFPSADEIKSGSTSDHRRGPYTSVHVYLIDAIIRELSSEDRTTVLADLSLLKTFAATLPDLTLDGPPFVLSFPDYGYQNILVDQEGNVTGLIDWDGLTIGPRQSGFARYPSWITRDWDPLYYGYRPPNGPPVTEPSDNDSQFSNTSETNSFGHKSQNMKETTRKSISDLRVMQQEDSPETLALFREEYLQIYTKVDPTNAISTRDSHILEALEIAVTNKFARSHIMDKLTEYVFGPRSTTGEVNSWLLSRAISEGKWLGRMVGKEKLAAGGKYI